MLKENKIYNIDCLEGFTQIDDSSIDLVLTDPPYNISQSTSRFHVMGRSGIDFGEWDKGFDQTAWLKEVAPKIKVGGSLVIFNAVQNIGAMHDTLVELGFTFKEMGVLKKSNPMPRNRDRLYVTAMEPFVWFVKGRGWTFNRQRDNYENGIFDYSNVSPKDRIHTTQKPLGLMEDLLRIHSNENDTVLDCFSGSGTTALACHNLNRKFIGFELDETNYTKSIKRLNDKGINALPDFKLA